jgi:hypothetical protein
VTEPGIDLQAPPGQGVDAAVRAPERAVARAGSGPGALPGDPLAACVAGLLVAIATAALLGTAVGRLQPEAGAAALAVGAVATAAAWLSRAGRSFGGAVAGMPARVGNALALLAFAAVSVRQFGWLVYERDGALRTLLPSNYGDLPLHWTYVRQMAGGASFWPADPILTGERLSYPLGVDLLTALLFQLGAALPVLLVVMGLVGAALTALALRRWGGGFAVAGLLCAGGLAGFQILRTGRLVDYQDAVAWKSLYLTLLVPQRGLLLALPAGLLLLASWRRRLLRGERALPTWVEGTLWGVLPLVHLHSFLFVSLVGAVWALGSGRWRELVVGFLYAVVPATWSVWQVTGGFHSASLVGLAPGWMIGRANPLLFLLVNFGLWLPLAILALAHALRQRRREELLLLAPALAVFAALFVVRVAPWEWDNTKLMLWCYLVTLPPIETLVLAKLPLAPRAATLGLLFFSGAICVLAASVATRPALEILDQQEYEGVCAALAGIGRDERVATAQVHNHPVALCGQPIVAGYGGHLWSHGHDATRVESDLARLLAGDEDWVAIARRLDARYVFWGVRERLRFPSSRRPWAGQPVASGSWGTLYRMP